MNLFLDLEMCDILLEFVIFNKFYPKIKKNVANIYLIYIIYLCQNLWYILIIHTYFNTH